MKASEVKEAGFYWYFNPLNQPPTIVRAVEWSPGRWTFFYSGDEIDRDPEDMVGDFVGPLVPPT